MKYNEDKLMPAHHRAFLCAQKISDEDKNFEFIYNKNENLDILKALVQLYLCTKYGFHSRNASELVEEKVNFRLVESDVIRYNNPIIEK